MPNKMKFKPMKARFRATFSGAQLGAGRLGNIDAENEVLHDVQITLEGEALGHGIWLDRQFCEDVAAAGNATGDVGLKVRYGHPAMCSDAIGTELGRAKNFRVVDVEREIEGEKVQAAGVVADVHLLKSAHSAPQGDIAKHVLETAKEDPKQFGQSIVFTYADWVVKDADGNRHSYKEEVSEPFAKWNEENPDASNKEYYAKFDELYKAWSDKSADGKIYAVLGKLHGSDFTDTPAATDGIFSTNTLAEEAETMLEEHPQILEVLEKNPKSVVEFLDRTGLAEKIESARVAGLQAAKDKEIAALKAEIGSLGEKNAELQKKGVELLAAAEDQHKVAVQKFESDIKERDEALAAAKAECEQLRAELDKTTKALSDTKAALDAETERYRAQVGGALQQPDEVLPTLEEGLARCASPAEKSAFIASGKYRIK
jgi:predicted  nucleic acid-binding Zn-ribbon protein